VRLDIVPRAHNGVGSDNPSFPDLKIHARATLLPTRSIDPLRLGNMLGEIRPLDLAARGPELLQHREALAAARRRDHSDAGIDRHLKCRLTER
jgi:hypothetical protein